MIQLINFWTDLVYNGEKDFDAVPDKIKGDVMKQLIKAGVVTNDNIEDVIARQAAAALQRRTAERASRCPQRLEARFSDP